MSDIVNTEAEYCLYWLAKHAPHVMGDAQNLAGTGMVAHNQDALRRAKRLLVVPASARTRWTGHDPIDAIRRLEGRLGEARREIQELRGHPGTSTRPKRKRRAARRQAERDPS